MSAGSLHYDPSFNTFGLDTYVYVVRFKYWKLRLGALYAVSVAEDDSWKAAMTQEGGCSVRGGVWKMGLAFKMSALG